MEGGGENVKNKPEARNFTNILGTEKNIFLTYSVIKKKKKHFNSLFEGKM